VGTDEPSGEPISYIALEQGTPVLAADGDAVGKVAHVLADVEDDIFDGIVIDTKAGPGGIRFVDAPEVAEIRERAVVVSLSAEDAQRLPKPEPNPAVMESHGVEDSETPLAHKLHRAWEIVSGKG
jgi:hypothetical protein